MDFKMVPCRGEIYYADMGSGIGSEQGGTRPVLVVQNDKGNVHSPTTIIATITSKQTKAKLPTHVAITSVESGLPQESIVLCEQVRTIDKKRLSDKIGNLSVPTMKRINLAMAISVGIVTQEQVNKKKEEIRKRSIN